MTFPIFPAHELGLVFAVLSGFGFGFVLERSGFGRAQKLVGQFYGYDLSVFKVMFTAVVTAMLVVAVLSGVGLTDFKVIADHATSETLLVPFAVGGVLVGMGFVMSGYCPGTSWVAMASGKLDGLFTVAGSIVGGLVWAELEGRPGFSKLHDATNLGNFYLWELLHLPARSGPIVLAAAVIAMAIGSFFLAEKVERLLAPRADPLAVATPGGRPRRFVFAGMIAAGVAGLAALALPTGTAAGARRGEVISPAELAQRVFGAPWTVRVVDLRPMAACAAKRVPGSECVPEADLAKLRLADASPSRDLVLLGEGDLAATPPAAVAFPGRLLSLSGGWKAWEAYALAPAEPPAPGASAAEVEAYRVQSGIRSALTGMKAAPPPPPPTAAPGGGPKKGGGGCSG
ncbi:MAG TPA: YeeE/YedE thiosulfate transporter family protein [Anaeromyxobacter sp.]|nr:YeeE/YedE thiosulfate transporter family protein [Anaeromyxobacter sp.]